MAKRNGATGYQFMHVAKALVAAGDFLNKREILEAVAGTGIVEGRLSTYLWECKAHGGDLVKEKKDGVPKWKMTVLPTVPDFNARKTAAGVGQPAKVAKTTKPAKVTMTTEELVNILKEEMPEGSLSDTVADLQPMAEAAAKPSKSPMKRTRSKPSKEASGTDVPTEQPATQGDEVDVRAKELADLLS